VGVRPEDVETTTNEDGLALTVEAVEEMGPDAYVYATPQDPTIRLEGADEEDTAKPFVARVDGRRPLARGQTIHVYPKPGHVHLFDLDTGVRINP
ncbi:MAG: TOBE domain-containing protein, partial [Dermatophilaceae bacterium]